MRKLFASILVFALIAASFSMTIFAAENTALYFGDGATSVAATSDSITLPLYFDLKDDSNGIGGDEGFGIDTFALGLKLTNATMAVTLSKLSSFANYDYDSKNSIINASAGDFVPTEKVTELATIVITRADDAKSSVLSFDENTSFLSIGGYNYEDIDYKTLTITWPTSDPEPVVVAAEANREVAGYTDVVNFSSVLTGVSGDNPTLTFDLYENGVFHKSYEESLGNGITLDNSTLSFKIAILGAPTDTTITLVNPAVK